MSPKDIWVYSLYCRYFAHALNVLSTLLSILQGITLLSSPRISPYHPLQGNEKKHSLHYF